MIGSEDCEDKIRSVGGCQPLRIFEKEMTDLNAKMDKLDAKMDGILDKMNVLNSAEGSAGKLKQLESDVNLLFWWVRFTGGGIGAVVIAVIIKLLLK